MPLAQSCEWNHAMQTAPTFCFQSPTILNFLLRKSLLFSYQSLKGALSDLFISYLLNILISSSILSSKRMK